jgi:cytochrome c551/c552/mono/diheme cytochrome c family protein
MSSWLERAWLAAAFAFVAGSVQAGPYDGIGRPATAPEIAAWDIDVRPDFKGLPKGAGSVAKGMQVWESKCASCHGVFGESNQVFSAIVGGTTADDIRTGRVARLNDGGYPGRSTLMKLATVSTLWDYINRAMPWNAPKTLAVDEVYGVTAYILNLGGIVPDEFTLSDRNIAAVQARLPNRAGMSTSHGLWPGAGSPDVRARACMADCAGEPAVASRLPAHARDSHGNLAEQNRLVGPQRGADTRRVAGAPAVEGATTAQPASAVALAQKYACTACHGMDRTIVGPGFREIARKYAGKGDAAAYLAGKVQTGSSGVWGSIPMPPQNLGATDAREIARWLAGGATE